jgi:3-phosphoshikimate 1-carboxyvinyltransferase
VLEVTGLGPEPPVRKFEEPLDCGRSGTTMRLGAGLLAGLPFTGELTGHPQLLRRPMERVAEPLRRMGAEAVTARGGLPPIRIRGGNLSGIEFVPPEASAQVKSAVLIAALRASGSTMVAEPVPTRDHTERLLVAMGAAVTVSELGEGRSVRVGPSRLGPLEIQVPGDASSAAVLAAAAALVPGSDLVLEAVSTNPSRTGFLAVLERMGATIEFEPRADCGPEPSADIRVRQVPLRSVRVGAFEVPSLIDELPLLGLLATAAEGTTEVRGASELRVKESDRISGLVAGLRALGAKAEELDDGFVVHGPTALRGAACDARTDHRLAMTFTLAGLVSQGPVRVEGAEFISDSFPNFLATLRGLS